MEARYVVHVGDILLAETCKKPETPRRDRCKDKRQEQTWIITYNDFLHIEKLAWVWVGMDVDGGDGGKRKAKEQEKGDSMFGCFDDENEAVYGVASQTGCPWRKLRARHTRYTAGISVDDDDNDVWNKWTKYKENINGFCTQSLRPREFVQQQQQQREWWTV